MNRTKLVIGLLVVTGISMMLTNGTQLAVADTHEGVGSMLGLSEACSAGERGGVNGDGTQSNGCYKGGDPNIPPYQRMCAGGCAINCPSTAGQVCNYTGVPGSCDDGSASCGDIRQDWCFDNFTHCACSSVPWVTIDCGDRNTCQ